MFRGTTPTVEFTLPFDCSMLECVFITFSQNKRTKLEKTMGDCEINEKTMKLKLSQEETLSLSGSGKVEIQIRAKTYEGEALASQIMSVTVDRILKEGVI